MLPSKREVPSGREAVRSGLRRGCGESRLGRRGSPGAQHGGGDGCVPQHPAGAGATPGIRAAEGGPRAGCVVLARGHAAATRAQPWELAPGRLSVSAWDCLRARVRRHSAAPYRRLAARTRVSTARLGPGTDSRSQPRSRRRRAGGGRRPAPRTRAGTRPSARAGAASPS